MMRRWINHRCNRMPKLPSQFMDHAIPILTLMTLILFIWIPAEAETTLRVASWNINNLHQDAGRALRSRAPIRQEQDYSHLISYQKKLNADIIALQEMGSPRAAARIFQPEEYNIIFSSRYNQPLGNGRMKGDIFTALAIRRSIRIIQHEEVVDLQRVVPIKGKNSWTRRGVAALIEVCGKRFWVLSIHLKSSCHGRSLENPANIHCVTLAEQRKVLEIWIDERFNDGIPFMILGDFNRYIDIHGQNDHLWSHIDDQEPIGLDLWRLPYHRSTQCSGHKGRNPIDFLVFDDRAWKYVKKESFVEIIYTPEHAALGNRISDHCPISVDLSWP